MNIVGLQAYNLFLCIMNASADNMIPISISFIIILNIISPAHFT
jgi:hypothetical protein